MEIEISTKNIQIEFIEELLKTLESKYAELKEKRFDDPDFDKVTSHYWFFKQIIPNLELPKDLPKNFQNLIMVNQPKS